MINTRHSWSIKGNLLIYTCPQFLDKNGVEIELEDELSDHVECMICDEQFVNREQLYLSIKRLAKSFEELESLRLREGLASSAGIDPEKAKDWSKKWHKVR